MKAAMSGLAIDGVRHIWDAAARGGAPLCGADVWMIEREGYALGCWRCMEVVYDEIRVRQRRSGGKRGR